MKNFNHCCFKVCNRLCVCPLKHKLSDILTRTKWQFLIYTGSSRIPHKTRNKKQQASFFFLLFRKKKKKKVLKRGKITSGFSQIEQSEKDVVNCRKTWKSVFSHANDPQWTVPPVNSWGRSSPRVVRCRAWPMVLIKRCLSVSLRAWVLLLENFQAHGSPSFSFYSCNSLTPGKSFMAFNCIRCTVRHMFS